MKISTATCAALIYAIASSGITGAWAQKGGKAAHKKPPVASSAADKNRVARPDYGISFVIPEGYAEHIDTTASTTANLHVLRLEGPRTSSFVTTGMVNHYIATDIRIYRFPGNKMKASDLTYTADNAKQILDGLNAAKVNGGNPLNYQNSAKIEVDGHPALAILCGASLSQTSDRALARLIFFRHRGELYFIIFQALDAEFETRVPSFEKFMASLKFLQPNVEPSLDDKPAPVNIEISK